MPASTSILGMQFSLGDPEHLSHLRTVAQTFSTSLKKLKKVHVEMALPIGAIVVSELMSNAFWWLFWEAGQLGCAGYVGYLVHAELIASLAAYKQAFQEALEAFKWVMGSETSAKGAKLRDETIQQFILTLAPYISSATLKQLLKDESRQSGASGLLQKRLTVTGLLQKRPTVTKEFKAFVDELNEYKVLGKQEWTVGFHVYGENVQGDMLAVIKQNGIKAYQAGRDMVLHHLPAPTVRLN